MHAEAAPHEVPSGIGVSEQIPLTGSQVPGMWHASATGHATEFEPTHAPDWQESVCVQALPSLQPVPFGAAGLEHVPLAGSQVPAAWH
jgi:hypothetical protein